MSKTWIVALMAAVALQALPTIAEAKRFGGGKSLGIQRAAPAKPAPTTPPAQQAQPAQAAPTQAAPATAAAAPAAAAAAGAAAKRSWMAPLAGLAAGLGLAALASHLGFGEELASFMMLALLAIVAVVVIRLVMRRFGGAAAAAPRMAAAGAGAAAPTMARTSLNETDVRPAYAPPAATSAAPAAGSGLQIGSALAAPALPPGFDAEGFERIARTIFVRMQAANDAADLDDLRRFTTPELFASLKLDLIDRGPAPQHTEVLDVAAEVQEVAEEDGQQIVSVRFTGRVQEGADQPAEAFDEVWHLVKPVDDSRAWAIAGVQQHA